MFDIRITIGTIGYEQTITALFPAVLEKCRGIQDPNLLLRLLLELGEDALPVLLGVMERLQGKAKQELLCQCMPDSTDRKIERISPDRCLGQKLCDSQCVYRAYRQRTGAGWKRSQR